MAKMPPPHPRGGFVRNIAVRPGAIRPVEAVVGDSTGHRESDQAAADPSHAGVLATATT
jgi:hypothetical protein